MFSNTNPFGRAAEEQHQLEQEYERRQIQLNNNNNNKPPPLPNRPQPSTSSSQQQSPPTPPRRRNSINDDNYINEDDQLPPSYESVIAISNDDRVLEQGPRRPFMNTHNNNNFSSPGMYSNDSSYHNNSPSLNPPYPNVSTYPGLNSRRNAYNFNPCKYRSFSSNFNI